MILCQTCENNNNEYYEGKCANCIHSNGTEDNYIPIGGIEELVDRFYKNDYPCNYEEESE